MPADAEESYVRRRASGPRDMDTRWSDNEEKQYRRPRVYRRITYSLFCTLPLLVLCYISYIRFGPASRPSLPDWTSTLSHGDGAQKEFDDETRPQLALVLHPELHRHRAPTTRRYDWRVTPGTRSPDGVTKRVYLINDQFPGPFIEARTGDTIVVNVYNGLVDQELAIHWHGMRMTGTQEMDGAVGFTQCPIPPGESYSYNFTVEGQHGTFWYHAHSQVQRGDGLYGGLVIHKPDAFENILSSPSYNYDEERLLIISDWYHRDSRAALSWYLRSGSFGNEPVPDSLVVNDNGMYNCSKILPGNIVQCIQRTPEELLPLLIEPGKKYRFRVVHAGMLAGFSVRSPGADFRVIEVDGGSSVASEAASSIGVLYPGERMDFIASWSPADARTAFMEVKLDPTYFRYPSPTITGTQQFAIEFLSTPRRISPRLKWPELSSNNHLDLRNLTAASPLPTSLMPQTADITMVLYANTMKLSILKNIPHGFFNQTTWLPQTRPSYPLLALPRAQWNDHQFVPFIPYTPTSPKWVDIVLNNLDDSAHSFHGHGLSFYVLSACADGTYYGSYNPFDASSPPCGAYNLVNPVKKDTIVVPKRGYAVLRFRADNPGVWMFHCHMLWHQASGMTMGFEVGEEEGKGLFESWSQERKERVLKFCKAKE